MVYARGISYAPFVFDDGVQIFQSAFMKGTPFYYITHSLTPIPFLVWKLISFLFGTEQTFPFHLMNILLHAFNALLVWKISKILFAKISYAYSDNDDSSTLPYLVSVLFILHPIQVESVQWISSLRTVLGGTFALSGLYYFLVYCNFLHNEQRPSGPIIISYISIFMVVFTYPPMISVVLTFPFFLILSGHKIKELLLLRKDKSFVATNGLLLIFLGLTFFIHKTNILSKSFAIVSFNAYLQLIFSTLGQYIINTLMPVKLYFDYQINPLTLNYLKEDLQFNHALYVGIIGTLTTASFFISKKTRVLGYAIICYTIFLLPNLGIIHHDFHNISTVSDRYLYLSLFPYALILTFILQKLKDYLEKSHLFSPLGISLFIALTFSALSIHQVGLWKNQEEFLERSTPKAQLSTPLLISLGNLYKNKGHYNRAAGYYQEALTSDPNSRGAFNGLVDLFFNDPNMKSAERVSFLITRKIVTPTQSELVSIAKIFYFMKDFGHALTYAKKSLFLGVRTQEATELIQLAADFKKEEVRSHLDHLFKIYYSTNRFQMARRLNNELLRLYPQNHEYLEMKQLLLQSIKSH